MKHTQVHKTARKILSMLSCPQQLIGCWEWKNKGDEGMEWNILGKDNNWLAEILNRSNPHCKRLLQDALLQQGWGSFFSYGHIPFWAAFIGRGAHARIMDVKLTFVL